MHLDERSKSCQLVQRWLSESSCCWRRLQVFDFCAEIERVYRSKPIALALLGLPAGEFQEFLVLVADELDHLGTISHNLLLNSDSEWTRVRFRIVNRDVDLQVTEVHPTEP